MTLLVRPILVIRMTIKFLPTPVPWIMMFTRFMFLFMGGLIFGLSILFYLYIFIISDFSSQACFPYYYCGLLLASGSTLWAKLARE